jgi:filamentous hemagglutinin family protein
MSYQNPSCKRTPRLSTPVRLGVAAVAACFISTPVLSLPVNPTVVNGTAGFNQVGNVLTVTNSNGAIINWQKFSIQAGETTYFAQTSSSSSVLNRVLNDPTAIYGTLSSNGRVWLVNPAGIMVGPGGKVDVAGFVASTLNISNADFLAGRNVFINDGSAKNVINQGEIRTPAGGSVYLIGSNVTNEGIIVTPGGETILAAGATVSLIDSATPGVKVDVTGAEGNATNLGTITAEAGRIGIAGVIVRNSGQINASSVVSEGGRVFLRASQDVYVDGNGRIVTTGTKGGSVEVLGNRVAVMDNAEIDASGTNGGGRIMVGGDYQGKNPAIQNANITYFGPNASLRANATEVGDGGTVIVWADDTTRAYGSISARGGALGGNGGFVETSGHDSLSISGARVDTRAPNGQTGNWLLDPTNVSIFSGGPTTPIGGIFDPSNNTIITDADVNAAIVSTGLIIQTAYGGGGAGNITVSGVNIYGGGALTLAAYGGGSATGNISIYGGSSINVGGGFSALAGWNGDTYTKSDVIDGKGSITISNAQIHANGNIELFAGKDITLGSTNNASAGTGTWIDTAGTMNVRAQNLSLYGGQTAIFNISSPQGPSVWLHSGSEQQIEVENQILLQAGSANNTTYGGMGSMFYGGSVSIQSDSDQSIEATILKLVAGAQGHDNAATVQANGDQLITLGKSGPGQLIITGGGGNTATYGGSTAYGGLGSYNNFAEIWQGSPTGSQVIILETAGSTVQLKGGDGTGYGGYFSSNPASEGWSSNNYAGIHNQGDGSLTNGGFGQVIDFYYGGTLSVTGGSAGNNNFASIGNQSQGMVVIGSSNGPAALPAITLTGGASGGKDFGNNENLSNSADIYSEAMVAPTQISGSSITITAGGDANTIGGAGIGANNLLLQTPGNLTLSGGGSNLLTSFPIPGAATAAWIGSDNVGDTSITIKAGGNISMTAGNGYGGAVMVGTVDGGPSTTIDIGAYGGITLTSGTNSSVVIGNVAPGGDGGSDISIKSIGNLAVTGTDNAQVWIGSLNGGSNPTKVVLGSMRNVTLNRAQIGSVNADAASIGFYGGYMDDGYGGAVVSPYGGSLSFTRTRIADAAGLADVGFYAAYGGAGTGNISFSDGGGAYGDSITIVADRNLTLDAVNKGVRLQTNTGLMAISVGGNFSVYGGNVVRGPNDTNFFGQPVPYGGAQIRIQAGTGGQIIDVAGTMWLQSGTVNNSYGGNSSYYGGAVTLASDGMQTISAGGLTLQAGASGHDNTVHVTAFGDQTINVYGGGLTLRGGGGTGSYNNDVGIFQDSPGGLQTINVFAGGTLAGYGGAGTGLLSDNYTWSCGYPGPNLCSGLVSWNGARIRQGGSGDQTINFAYGGALWLEGGSGGNLNRAMISSESGGAQFVNGTAAITLKGGASGGTYYGGADAYLDNGAMLFAVDPTYALGSQTISGSSLTMNGGASAGTAGAYIFSATQDITITGNVSLTGGSGAGFHNRAQIYTDSLFDQTITVGGNLTLQAGSAGHKNDAGIWAYGGAQTLTVGGKLAAYGGTGGYDNAAFIGVDAAATAAQTINAGSIHLQAGGGTGPNAGYNNSAKIYYDGTGDQNVTLTGTGATVVLIAGSGTGIYGGAPDSCKDGLGNVLAACANVPTASNTAQITARGANQTLDFVYGGGSLALTGGSGGNNNQALVYLAGTGTQTISGAPDVSLTAGSGGVYIRDIDYLLGSNARIISKGTQAIDAGALTMTGGTSGASQAVITTPGALVVNATGNVTLNGGGSNTVTSYYGGVLESTTFTLPGATAAVLGSATDTTGITVNAGRSITANGGTSGVRLRSTLAANVDLNAGWDSALAQPSGYGGDITLNGPVFIQAPGATGNVFVVAHESSTAQYGSINVGSGSVAYGGIIAVSASGNNSVYGSLLATSNLMLDAGWNDFASTPSQRGGDLLLGSSSRLQGGFVEMYAAAGLASSYGGGNITQNAGSSIVAYGGNDIVMYADRNIALNGSANAYAGLIYARAGYNETQQFGGNLTTSGTLSGYGGVDLIAEAAAASGANGSITQSGSITAATGTVNLIGGGNVSLNGGISAANGTITVKSGYSDYGGAVTPYGGNLSLAGTSNIAGYGGVYLYAESGSAAGANGGVSQAANSVIAANTGSVTIFGGGNVTLNGNVSAYGGSGSVRAGVASFGGSPSGNGGNITVSGKLYADFDLELLASAGGVSGANGSITQSAGSITTGVGAYGGNITIVGARDTTLSGTVSSGAQTRIGAGLNPLNTGLASGYGGGINFSAGKVEARNSGPVVAVSYGGNINQAAAQSIVSGYGGVTILAYGDAVMNGTTTANYGGSISIAAGAANASGLASSFGLANVRAGSSNIASINQLNAVYGGANVQAAGAILRSGGNANGVNIVADSVALTSVNGGPSNGLAISAFTQATSSLTADVNAGTATYGGISVQNFGAQPGTISLIDGALNPAKLSGGSASIAFYNSGDLALNGSAVFNSSNSGDMAISSGGNLDYSTGLAPTSGSVQLSAKNTLNMVGSLTNTGDLQLGGSVVNVDGAAGGANVVVSANTININGSVTAAKNVALAAPLVGGIINLYGGVTANGTSSTPSSINGIPYTGIAFIAQDLNAYGGYLNTTTATGDISGLVSGNITLNNGANFKAGNDIDLVLAGGGSTVALNGSYMLADYMTAIPATIYIDFLTRGSGGVMIDGTATTTSLPGGSGFFVVDQSTPATDSAKTLVITYANATVVDPCVASPDLCKPPSPIDNPITDINQGDPCATSPDSAQCKAKTAEKDKDKEKGREFGEEETGNKDEKSSQKKVAQCT